MVAVADTVEVGSYYRIRTLLALDLDLGFGLDLEIAIEGEGDGSNTHVAVYLDLDLVPALEVGQAHYVVDGVTRHLLDLAGGLWHVVSSSTGPRTDVHRMVLDK